MKHQESKSAIKLRHWIKANPRSSCSIETKDSRGKNYLNYSEITEAQINYALAIQSEKGVLIRATGVTGLPDYIYLRNEPAYFCIKYPRGFCLINVNNLIHEMRTFKKKSLDYNHAKDIAVAIF